MTDEGKRCLWEKAVDLWAESKITGHDLKCLHDMFCRKRRE